MPILFIILLTILVICLTILGILDTILLISAPILVPILLSYPSINQGLRYQGVRIGKFTGSYIILYVIYIVVILCE